MVKTPFACCSCTVLYQLLFMPGNASWKWPFLLLETLKSPSMVVLLLAVLQHGTTMNMKSSEIHEPLSMSKICVGVRLEIPDSRGSGEQRCPSSSSTALVPAPQRKIPNCLSVVVQWGWMERAFMCLVSLIKKGAHALTCITPKPHWPIVQYASGLLQDLIFASLLWVIQMILYWCHEYGGGNRSLNKICHFNWLFIHRNLL